MGLSAKLRAKRAMSSITAEKFMTAGQRYAYREPKSKIDIFFNRMLIISLAVIISVYTIITFYKGGYITVRSGCKEPIGDYFEAICERDFDSYVESMPYEWRTDYQSQLLRMNCSKYDYLNLLYADLFNTFGEDMDIRLTYLSEKRSDSLTSRISQDFYEKFGRSIDIEDCCIVEVAAHFTGSIFSSKQYINCTVVKLKGKWYIIDAAKKRKIQALFK